MRGDLQPVVSKELFCQVISMIREQEETDAAFSRALEKVGDGHFIFGVGNKYYEALMLLLKECAYDRYDYISWWLYRHVLCGDRQQDVHRI